jgi:hypothetical protein
MRRLAIGSAFAAVAATVVLAQSPNTPPQIQTTPGQFSGPGGAATTLPQKPLLPSTGPAGGVPQSNPGMPSSILGTATIKSKQPLSLGGAETIPLTGTGNPAKDAATKIEPAMKAKAGGLQAKSPSFPKKDEIKATAGPAEVTMQPIKIGPGKPAVKSSESGGSGSGGGTPKGDSEQSAADQLKGLVPAIAGPRRPPGEPKQEGEKQAAGKQREAKPSKSIGVGSPLGAGLGPKSTPPTTGEADPPIPQQSETKITARPLQATPASTPDMDSEQSGMAEEKIEIAKEKVERP